MGTRTTDIATAIQREVKTDEVLETNLYDALMHWLSRMEEKEESRKISWMDIWLE